jgi:4-amino-4-deoxy-L-arabinose transferase-like glycosyltransferase
MFAIADRPAMPEEAARFSRISILLLIALFAARLIFSAIIPLAYDEAYYWTWSKHLAGGYFDHPPMIALLIRLGTMIAGDTHLGVRLAVILVGIPSTWAVWTAGRYLSEDARVGPAAAVLFNLMPLIGGVTLLATPDAPLTGASCFVLLCWSALAVTGRPHWWLALGVAIGCALLSKYSALFFGAGLAAWVLLARAQRRWLTTAWPYVAALIAFLLFLPVVRWNAAHGWASFIKQLGRMRGNEWSARHFLDFIAAQVALITPPILALALVDLRTRPLAASLQANARLLLTCLIAPFIIYFCFHSLHSRADGNWLAPIYPAVAVLAAIGAFDAPTNGRWRRVQSFGRVVAIPLGITTIALLYVQSAFGVVPLGSSDPTARQLGVGWQEIAREIDGLRERERANLILTTQYSTLAWLRFYLPSKTAVVQINEAERWVNEPAANVALFAQPLLYVCYYIGVESCEDLPAVKIRFAEVALIGSVPRRRGGDTFGMYGVYRVAGPLRDLRN